MLNFNSVMISSEDPKPLVEFYKKILGEPKMEDSGYTGWLIGSGFLSIGAHDKVKGKAKEPERVILFFETKEVKEEFEKMKDKGAKVIAEPYKPDPNGEFWLATLADPDGNFFQLASPWDS